MSNGKRQVGGRVTILDVAAKSGVAISSVSAALNGLPGVSEATRERVRTIADGMGYVPSLRAKSLSSKKAFAIGLVVERPASTLEADPFFGAFIAGVERAAALRGYSLVLQMAEDDAEGERRYRELAASRRVDGVILDELRDPDPRIELVQELELAAAGVVPGSIGFPFPVVQQSSAPGVAELVGHLVGLGHRRVAHVAGPPGYVHTLERIAAWRDALAEAGLPEGPLLTGDFTYEGGCRAADVVLGMPAGERPTAVVCVNDLCAVGFMARLQDAGVAIPDDMSVTGYDSISLGGYIRPRLTTVRSTPRAVGAAAADLLLDTIDDVDGRQPDVRLAPGAMVVRESTGPAPRAA